MYGRMKSLNINYPDVGNAMLKAEQIKGSRMNNALRRRQLERDPEVYSLQKRKSELSLKERKAEYNLEKLRVFTNLMRSVNDQASYDRAVMTYFKTFPDEIGDLKEVPRKYNPKVVSALIDSSTSEAERIAKMNLRGKEITAESKIERLYPTEEGWQPRQSAIGKKEPEKGTKDSLPSEVKWATDVIKKFAPKSMDPMMAATLETFSPGLIEKLEQQKKNIPKSVKPLWDRALSILQRHFKLPQDYEYTATNPDTGERVGWDKQLKKWVPIK
jgi:hypothetical protein